MIFNVVARNHDDHSKNFAFTFDEHEGWQLAPAFDVAFSYKPGSKWVNLHWMTLNGKRDDFRREDFYSFIPLSPLFTKRKIDQMLDEIITSVARWPSLAGEFEVPETLANWVNENLRLNL